MSTLKLRVDKLLDSQQDVSVVASITPLPARRGESVKGRFSQRNLLVPAGNKGTSYFREVEVPPGRYLVEAVLPSGDVLQDEVTIQDGDPPRELILQAEDSPHEWLSSQHLYGMVSNASTYRQMQNQSNVRGVPTAEVIAVSTRTPLPTTPASGEPNDTVNVGERGLFFALPQVDTVPPELWLNYLSAVPLPVGAAFLPVVPYAQDGYSQVYRFTSAVLSQTPGLGYGSYGQSQVFRHYFFVASSETVAQYCVLPVPWAHTDGSGEAEVEVLLQTRNPPDDPSPGYDQGYRLSATINDAMAGPMIAYLGGGKLEAAISILEPARDLLYGKQVNPMGAAAGAYVLIANWSSIRGDYVLDWIRNLMNLFPWLPDGAIQHGWVLLKGMRKSGTLDEARAALLEGFRRGLPFFSAGVRMLLDGLTLFANDARESGSPDAAVEEALKTVRWMALRTNMRQPFTTILLR